ncbi:MAG: hypothetical protein Ct9H300mP1_01640 [Planctomycetaceae bacterium]|nr:MAG: hypothetical protein Ct9H300mP1_01640 [Planctomycetaceae bacterium]
MSKTYCCWLSAHSLSSFWSSKRTSEPDRSPLPTMTMSLPGTLLYVSRLFNGLSTLPFPLKAALGSTQTNWIALPALAPDWLTNATGSTWRRRLTTTRWFRWTEPLSR